MCGCLLCAPPTGDLVCSPGMCPDWESNQQPFALQAGGTQSSEPHQPGRSVCMCVCVCVRAHMNPLYVPGNCFAYVGTKAQRS